MHAAATAAYLLPVRSWKASCPGTPTPTTSAPGHSHPANPANPRLRTSPRRRPREPATPAIATPAHTTSEYLHHKRIGSRWRAHDTRTQAILTLAWLEGGHTYRKLGAGNGVPKR